MGRKLILAGGSSGIGLALCERLHALDSSVELVSISRRDAHPNPTLVKAHIAADLSAGREAVQAAIAQAGEALGGAAHALVYCPGSINLRPFDRLSDADFQNDWQLNFMGAVQSAQAALPLLKAAAEPGQAGQLLFFSTLAVQTGFPYHASVSGAKGALEGLTRALAAELAPLIAVNAIAPGLTETPLAERLLKSETQRKSATERSPLKSIMSAAEVAAIAAPLLMASQPPTTGQVFALDGGLSAVRV